MFKGQKVVVVMPAYNAEKTLRKTYKEVMDQQIVDEVIVVDDASRDDTVAVALSLPAVRIQVHKDNKGYGANQKTCYTLALDAGADIVIMVHPDYQYTPKLIPAMAAMVGNGLYHCVIGSRILGGYALRGGMPLWKYVANRFLTLSENLLVGAKLSEYHSGYRAFSRQLLDHLNLDQNSDDFVFDNQMLIQIIWHGYAIAEVTCPTDYNEEASSINFRRSVKYGFGCLRTALTFRLGKLGLYRSRILSENRERCPRDRRPDGRSLTSVSVQGKGLLQNRGGERAPSVVRDIPPVDSL
jgi:glycosyltransferase involved in cell wall biosynthesis